MECLIRKLVVVRVCWFKTAVRGRFRYRLRLVVMHTRVSLTSGNTPSQATFVSHFGDEPKLALNLRLLCDRHSREQPLHCAQWRVLKLGSSVLVTWHRL